MILLISVDNDSITDEIVSWLSFQNKKFVRLNENQCITKILFDFEKENFVIEIEQKPYNLKEFKTIYYRNGTMKFNFFINKIDESLLNYFGNELQAISQFIDFYLKNNGAKIYGNLFTKTVNKLEVLIIAKSLGLKIPNTYIFSSIEDLKQTTTTRKFITKAISEMLPIFKDNGMYLNYTRSVRLQDFERKTENIIPTLIQGNIKKEFEIRVFIFHGKIWAIVTFDFTNEIDVRFTNVNKKKYVPYNIPNHIKIKISKLMNKLQLNCGTIDILKSGKEFYFLEINPLGQFQEVSYFGKYEIEKYIAEIL